MDLEKGITRNILRHSTICCGYCLLWIIIHDRSFVK